MGEGAGLPYTEVYHPQPPQSDAAICPLRRFSHHRSGAPGDAGGIPGSPSEAFDLKYSTTAGTALGYPIPASVPLQFPVPSSVYPLLALTVAAQAHGFDFEPYTANA